jgi:hypothetical protein
MTQQYIVGQFSLLLAELQPPPGDWLAAVGELRREVEVSPPARLPRLARQALILTDAICWAALEHGDAGGFTRCATTAAALRELADNAGLWPAE